MCIQWLLKGQLTSKGVERRSPHNPFADVHNLADLSQAGNLSNFFWASGHTCLASYRRGGCTLGLKVRAFAFTAERGHPGTVDEEGG
jgi:hypothetical protein